MNSILQYKCGSCSTIYDESVDAIECCPVETVYVCSNCESWYHDKDEADRCCAEDDALNGENPEQKLFKAKKKNNSRKL